MNFSEPEPEPEPPEAEVKPAPRRPMGVPMMPGMGGMGGNLLNEFKQKQALKASKLKSPEVKIQFFLR